VLCVAIGIECSFSKQSSKCVKMSQLKPNLPGRVVSVIQTIEPDIETFFRTVPSKCMDLLKNSGADVVKLSHLDINGNMISTHRFFYLVKEKKTLTRDDFMQVELRAELSVVTLIIRKDNLY